MKIFLFRRPPKMWECLYLHEARTHAMYAFTPISAPVMQPPALIVGCSIKPAQQSDRMVELTFPKSIVEEFLQAVSQWPVQSLEYKSFLRFQFGKILGEICADTLRPVLVNTLMNRAAGTFLIKPEGLSDVTHAEDVVKFSTAVAHLLGRSNFDAMSGLFYARLFVENNDASDSYLRQPHRVMELHNDGTFVNQITDYVLMMKIDEQNMREETQ